MKVAGSVDNTLLKAFACVMKAGIRRGLNPYSILLQLISMAIALVLTSHISGLVASTHLTLKAALLSGGDAGLYLFGMLLMYRISTDNALAFQSGRRLKDFLGRDVQSNKFPSCDGARLKTMGLGILFALLPYGQTEPSSFAHFATAADVVAAIVYGICMYVYAFQTEDVVNFKKRVVD